MIVGIISDTHLGYAWDTVRQEDSFVQAEEGMRKLIDAGAEVIIHAGDIFDSPIPRPEVMARAMDIFSECANRTSTAKITSFIGRETPKNKVNGIPVIAIHGNHERRPKGMMNPVQVLEKAGLLIYLHSSGVGINNELGIFGMGHVPERYALPAFQKFELKSGIEKNILIIHQTIKEIFSAPNDPATLTLSDLPNNFTTICGHIHWSAKKPNLILPGGTIRTQLSEEEPEEKKVYLLNTETLNLQEIKLETPRPFFYEKIDVTGKNPEQVFRDCELLTKKLEQNNRAIMKIKLTGKLAPGFEPRNLKLEPLIRKHPLLSVDRDFETGQSFLSLPQGVRLDEMLSKAIEISMEKRGLRMDAKLLINHLLAGDMNGLMEVLSRDTED